jgi:hypothetical protein
MRHLKSINEYIAPSIDPAALSGTSFQDVTITTTVNKLKRVLGEPKKGDNSNFAFAGETPVGDFFTLYDWNNKDLDPDAPIKFNIGAHSKIAALRAKDYIEHHWKFKR